MPSASVTVRIDENLKKQAEVLFNDMGLNMTTAFNLFIKAVVRQNKIPFEITANPLYGEVNIQNTYSNEEKLFAASMAQAAKDSSFIRRTLECQEDFKYVDSEGITEW